MKITYGPALKASLIVTETEIQKVVLTLNPGKGFEWEIAQGTPEKKLYTLIEQWMDAYCRKQELSRLPVCLNNLPPYTTLVLQQLHRLPKGATISYQELACRTGKPKAARAVGNACGCNPLPLLIPCHRVLAKDGIGGYSGGLEIKRTLLAFEGLI